jgi:hypothetical protein
MSAEDTVGNYCRADVATVPFPSSGPLQHELTRASAQQYHRSIPDRAPTWASIRIS